MKTSRQCASITRRNNIEWGACENCVAIVALHRCGMPPTKIVKTLTPFGINERLVFRTLSRYKETNDMSDQQRSGQLRVAQTKEVVCAVRAPMMRNRLQKQKIMVRDGNCTENDVSYFTWWLRTPSVQTLRETFINCKIKRSDVWESTNCWSRMGAASNTIFFSQMRKFLIWRQFLINKMTVCMRGHPSKPKRKCHMSSTDTIRTHVMV